MSPAREQLERILQSSLSHGDLSQETQRTLRETIGHLLESGGIPSHDRGKVCARAFDLARARLGDPHARRIVQGLELLVTALIRENGRRPVASNDSDAFFSPGHQCLAAVQNGLAGARATADICVFTITDDRIAQMILAAHRRKVAIRIVTDNDKARDEGSDVARFVRAGIEVRVDRSEFHMHHKFAVFDRRHLLNGSYNWTRGAAMNNDENLVSTHEPMLVRKFAAQFEKLWARFA